MKDEKINLTKGDLVHAVADETGLSVKATQEVVDVLIHKITQHLKQGDKVSLAPLGIFTTNSVAERTYHSFNQETTVPAHNRVKFSPSRKLREAVK